ncbi:MAG: hypothetical protein AB7K71_04350 [Polyangiaceae bacterium]
MKTLLAHNPIWELELLCADQDHRHALDRVGGAPWGLPLEVWPDCGSCKEPLTFIGQWQHAEGRLDLGGAGTVLYSFLCTNTETMMECHMHAVEPGGDVIARVVLVENAVATPTIHPKLEARPGASVVVTGWKEEGESALSRPAPTTRIGGRPAWIQDPYFQPQDDPWRYRCVAQWTPDVVLAHQRIQSEPAFLELEDERTRTDARVLERTITIGHGTALARTLGKRCGAIDGSFFNTTPEGGTRLSTPLESGVLSLLVDERSGEFCLQYFGR